jgi:isoleucyl-tRNA synthetase
VLLLGRIADLSKVLQSVTTFTSSTLSAFYFDVAKDALYCDPVDGSRRQAIIATLDHVSWNRP